MAIPDAKEAAVMTTVPTAVSVWLWVDPKVSVWIAWKLSSNSRSSCFFLLQQILQVCTTKTSQGGSTRPGIKPAGVMYLLLSLGAGVLGILWDLWR